jgi:hypothetical protein
MLLEEKHFHYFFDMYLLRRLSYIYDELSYILAKAFSLGECKTHSNQYWS